MRVTVKLVVFWHHAEGMYCSYCPELKCFFGRAKTVDEVVRIVRDEYLLWELRERFWCTNLWRRNWTITEDSVVPPAFTDEEAVQLTERSYELKIETHQLLTITVDVPEPARRRDLSGFLNNPTGISKGE